MNAGIQMTLKIIRISIIISISIAPCMFNSALYPSLLAQNDSITNERIPVKAKQLEEHWNIDCDGIFQITQQHLADQGDKSIDPALLYDDIKKCIHIYNTPDSAHYKAEPDFTQLLDQLSAPD